ncbi:hypothetical protein HKBW3S42_02271 [Candidatus Hakubella thermalkaliphila]|uniref:Uncharacterized protein n=1 Tax=Candidatus Hakubella thermalkaliphila TaxID=2754717 RepID=A0A6V8PMS5_9ACTN|nr:hypothetical protein HKBW3S42_02271 [Candidatus Hakubella thermalkaliphila]
MVKLGEIREQHNFEPKYTFSQLQRNLPHRVESQIQDSRLYKAVRMLTEKAYPTEEIICLENVISLSISMTGTAFSLPQMIGNFYDI